ncbi:MAG: methionyl-tRNA formyltransferase, partial [Alphaproteobacteria bacterium]|nr:methionyl-tRNA formyltransferase [Alphaproteobacteria bacterium]
EAAVVVAYGLLLPKRVLYAPRLGCFNVHASLLPRWRGAAPIQRALMAGDGETGISIMRMDEGLDTGPVCRMERLAIAPGETAGELHDRLAQLGARVLVETLAQPTLECRPQPTDGVTYAAKIAKSEAHIDFGRPASAVAAHINGLSPFPGAWFEAEGARIKVLRALPMAGTGTPGEVLAGEVLAIACGEGAVRLLELQREGKSALSADDFRRGFPLSPGSIVA